MVQRIRTRAWSIPFGGVVIGIAAMLSVPAVEARTCTVADVQKSVESAAESLRQLSQASEPQIAERIQRLRAVRGWLDGAGEAKAYEAVQDQRLRDMDAAAGGLFARLDAAGDVKPGVPVECAGVVELDAASRDLAAIMRQKSAYMITRLDSLIAETTSPQQPASTQPPPTAEPPQPGAATQPQPPAQPAPAETVSPQPTTAQPPVQASGPPKDKAPQDPSLRPSVPPTTVTSLPPWTDVEALKSEPKGQPKGWATKTERAPPPPAALVEPLPLPPPVRPRGALIADDGFSIDEIVAASEGIFGKLSASLGQVIEHAFRRSGRPSGYVLGQEGSGALLAGLRYGRGRLYMRNGDTREVFWHGPTIGADIGASGSRVMMLVYKLPDAEDVFAAFSGVEGSAYVVGGASITFLSNGRTQLAPIRTGVGLRLGASIGYLRLTRQSTWNPF